jgi:D-aminoacyl-tRNA deacylase
MSQPLIVFSEKDPAGMNIAQHLKGSGIELFKVQEDIISCDKELEGIGAEKIIFASRHRSEAGQACFTVHPIGNWGKAEKGGRDNIICSSLPIEMKQALIDINSHKDLQSFKGNGWRVSMEVTHHGPFCKVPCFFIEIGSSEVQWKNEAAGKLVADSLMKLFEQEIEKKWKVCMGVGGGHYSPKFTPLMLNSDFAFSHILPDYFAETVELETFEQAVKASDKQAELILIDWKGLKKAGRDRVIDFSEKIGMKHERA